jgi:hypothetical protein
MKPTKEALALPAGPLSGVTVALYHTKNGTTFHGTANCATLRKSNPARTDHEFGIGTRLGDLDWPDTHCDIEFPNAAQTAYLEQAEALAGAATATDAARDDWNTTTLDQIPGQAYPIEAGWRWIDLAPAVAALAAAPDDADLVNIDFRELEYLRTEILHLRGRLSAEVREAALPELWGYRTQRAEAATRTVARTCAARLVAGSYQPREERVTPWTNYRDRAWDGAHSVLNPPQPPDTRYASREHESTDLSSGDPRATLRLLRGGQRDSPDMRQSQSDNVFPSAMLEHAERLAADPALSFNRVMTSGGQASWPYFRIHQLLEDPHRPWTETLADWLNGSSYSSFPSDSSDRIRLARMLSTTMPVWAAAEAAASSYLDGLVDAARQTVFIAIPTRSLSELTYDWVQAAVILANNCTFFARHGRDRRTERHVPAFRKANLETAPGLILGEAPGWAAWAFRHADQLIVAQGSQRAPHIVDKLGSQLAKLIDSDGRFTDLGAARRALDSSSSYP